MTVTCSCVKHGEIAHSPRISDLPRHVSSAAYTWRAAPVPFCGTVTAPHQQPRRTSRSGYIEGVSEGRRKLILAIALVLTVGVAFVFGYRVGRHAHRLRWQNEPIRAWMSIPFIAHTHHVPAAKLYDALGVPANKRDKRSIRHIADDQYRPVNEVIRDVERAIREVHPGEAGKSTGAAKGS